MKDFNEKYEEILERLKVIEKILLLKQKQPKDIFVDNQEFLQIMNISKRTAQSWRENGIIGFSMIGNKIYYQMKEIHLLLEKHYIQTKPES